MAMNRRRKICIALAVFLLIFFIILPMVLGAALRGTVEKKIGEAIKAPVKLGSLSVKLLPPGAVLGDLEVGEPVSELGGAPLARIGTLKAGVTWGTVFGGPKHITSLGIYDVDLALACDEKGRSNLQRFIEQMGPSDRKDPLPVDSIVVKNARITGYVPPSILAPKSTVGLDPVTASIGYLSLANAVFPPPGQPMATERWMSIVAEDTRVVAPLKALASPASLPEAGSAMDEGAFLGRASFELAMPTKEGVLKIREGSVRGLKVRNVLHAPGTPETMERIIVSLKTAAKGVDGMEGRKGVAQDRAPFYVDGLQVRDSTLEIYGPDAEDQPAFWRLSALEIDVQKFPWGPGTETPAGAQGLLKIVSPTKSTSGDGQFLLEWTKIQGQWPKLSFDTRHEVKGFAMAPLSVRVQERADAGIRGQIDAAFAGPSREGALNWDGSVTLSPDIRLIGKSFKGRLLGSMAILAKGFGKIPMGKPIEGFGVRGTLEDPEFVRPQVVAKVLVELASQIMLEDNVSVPDIMATGAGDAVNKGLDEGKQMIKKAPGLGGLLGK